MSTIANAFTANDLKSAIVRNPLVVSAETPVMEAIAQMSGLRIICASDHSGEVDNVHQEARSSCVLVMGADKIIGILTERDVVRLCAKERSLNNLPVSEVMISPVSTLQETDLTDLFSAVNLLQQSRIRHMPIVDHHDRLLGIITHESLRQLARPVDLLRLRLVSEVMTANVVCAEPSTSMLAIAQLMSAHHVGSVLIVENQIDLEGNPLQIPLGIITERDIVQFQSLELQLEQVEVQAVMSAPVFAVRPDDTLMVVQQVMEQRSIRRLVVTGTQGELLGVVTQTSLLQALNPLELYTLSKLLEQKVSALEADKLRLLESYNNELERQVAQRTADLHERVEREQLISRIAAKIAASLYLPEILETAVQELRNFLSCDRLTIYQFHPDWTGAIVSESVGAGWRAALHDEIFDPCFRGDVVQRYNEGHRSAIANIHNAGYPDCYIQLLEEYQVKANLVVPIRVSGQLWGLLIAHQCDDYREWQKADLTLLDDIAVQLAIAIQQAEAYHQVQIELVEKQRVELSLRDSEQRFRAIFNNSFQFIGLLTLDGTLLEANQTALMIGGISHEDVVGRPFWEAYWWQISPETQAQLQQAIARAAKGEFVRYEVNVWGKNQTIIPIEFSLRPIFDASDRIVLLIPEGRDLRELKLSQEELKRSEQRFLSLATAAPVGIYRTDEIGNCTFVNECWSQIAGLTPEEAAGFGWINGIHPSDRELVSQEWNASIKANRPFKLEYRFQNAEGQVSWVLGQAVAERNESGEVIGYIGTITDISDRKKAEAERLLTEQIRQELKILEDVFDRVLAGYWDWDLQTNQEYLSPKLKKMFGYEDDEIPNSPESWQHLIFAEDLPKVLDCFDRHVQSRGEIPYHNEVRYQHKDGSTVWIICSGQVIKWDENNRPLRMVGCHIDVSDRKMSEERLRKSDTHLKIAQRIGKLGSWEFDPTSGLINWSDEVFHIFGRDPALGAPTFEEFQEYLHPEDREIHNQLVQSAINNCQTFENEVRFYCNGALCYFQARGEAVVDDSGNFILLVGTVLDITDRKLAEVKLQNLSDRLNLAIKSGAIGIWDWNVQDNILFWDERMYKLYGITADQFINIYDAWANSLHPDDRPRAEAAIQQALAGTKDFNLEFRVIHPDRSIRFLQAYALVQRNAQGEAINMIGINFDITDRKLAETKLMQTTAQLAASNRELEAFAYSVSHDLRAPLRAIDGFSQALLEDYGDKFDNDAKDYFDRIRHNVARMGNLIEDLLNLSRVSRSEMQYQNVNLSMLVQEQLEELQMLNPERRVEVAIAPNVCVSADPTLMRVVISNLIQNAWKFTSQHPTARIEFGVISSPDQQDKQLTYFVRDDGAGFDMNYAKMLFGVFQRLHNTNEFAGTGIGLATVQRAIHRHGGQVWAEGAVEQGATIYFTVPNSL
jgi:PAS domain S-box-containing protein